MSRCLPLPYPALDNPSNSISLRLWKSKLFIYLCRFDKVVLKFNIRPRDLTSYVNMLFRCWPDFELQHEHVKVKHLLGKVSRGARHIMSCKNAVVQNTFCRARAPQRETMSCKTAAAQDTLCLARALWCKTRFVLQEQPDVELQHDLIKAKEVGK